jgi:hypothetical protein
MHPKTAGRLEDLIGKLRIQIPKRSGNSVLRDLRKGIANLTVEIRPADSMRSIA